MSWFPWSSLCQFYWYTKCWLNALFMPPFTVGILHTLTFKAIGRFLCVQNNFSSFFFCNFINIIYPWGKVSLTWRYKNLACDRIQSAIYAVYTAQSRLLYYKYLGTRCWKTVFFNKSKPVCVVHMRFNEFLFENVRILSHSESNLDPTKNLITKSD